MIKISNIRSFIYFCVKCLRCASRVPYYSKFILSDGITYFTIYMYMYNYEVAKYIYIYIWFIIICVECGGKHEKISCRTSDDENDDDNENKIYKRASCRQWLTCQMVWKLLASA